MSQVIAEFRERFNKAPPPNQFKIYIESEVRIFWVYGDFSATLYISLLTAGIPLNYTGQFRGLFEAI